jgi:hypothetical protein
MMRDDDFAPRRATRTVQEQRGDRRLLLQRHIDELRAAIGLERQM